MERPLAHWFSELSIFNLKGEKTLQRTKSLTHMGGVLWLMLLALGCTREAISPGEASKQSRDYGESVWARLAGSVGPQNVSVEPTAYAVVRYVSQAMGSDHKGDGSKEKPWSSLNHALEQCREATPDKRAAILVGSGTYREASLALRPYVDFYGGYDSSNWRRDIWKHQSILDGQGTRRILVGADHARVDGFLITGGRIRGKGGAVLCEGVSPILSNNVFTANGTLSPEPWKPKLIHETANDGGAIVCLNGASPRIENNLFVGNTTEVGRGGAVACHRKASPAIVRNVFLNNEAGLKDPMRSSDGGAISAFDHSHPEIRENLVIANKALARNDGGGIFVALWSSPVISGNLIVGNACTDDAGGLFLGGQEHRYGVPLDPVPPADQFLIRVDRNIFVGNANPNKNSGATRITMETRAELTNNIVAENGGGLYLQRSEVVLRNNTVLQKVNFVEEKETVGPGVFVNNIFWGGLDLNAKATVAYCNVKGGAQGVGNVDRDPLFVEDGKKGQTRFKDHDGQRCSTMFEVTGSPGLRANELAGRPIRLGENWTTVKSNDASRIVVWGSPQTLPAADASFDFEVLPTWHLRSQSPCIDSGTHEKAPAKDFEDDPRSLEGGKSLAVDIGADEYRR